MVAKTILISGGFLVGLVCIGLFAIALLYLVYCAVVGHLEKRSLQHSRYQTPRREFSRIGEPESPLRAGATVSGETIARSNDRPALAPNRLH